MRKIILVLAVALCAASCGGGETPEGIPADGPMCVRAAGYPSCEGACEAGGLVCRTSCWDEFSQGGGPEVETCYAICDRSRMACASSCAELAARCAVLENYPPEPQDD